MESQHSTAQSQNHVLKGLVLYQSSGSKPAVNVAIGEVNNQDANTRYTTDKGEFTLRFSSKKPGDPVDLQVGKIDGTGQAIELVNSEVVRSFHISTDPEEVFEIIVCKKGQRQLAAQRYYKLIKLSIEDELIAKTKKFEDLVQQVSKYNKYNKNKGE